MAQLLLTILNLLLPVLLSGIAGCFILFLVVIIPVACVPAAGERVIRFLALLEELYYSGRAIPVQIDQKKLSDIEAIYAKRLLTPLSHIKREQLKSNLTLVSSAPTPMKRRTYEPSQTTSKPFQFLFHANKQTRQTE